MIKNSIITLLIIIACINQLAIAQCYDGFLDKGKKAFEQRNYVQAKKDFEQGLKCPEISEANKSELKLWCGKCDKPNQNPPEPHPMKTEIFSLNRKYGLRRGAQVLIKPIYDSLIYIPSSKGLFFAIISNGEFKDSVSLINIKGQIIIPFEMRDNEIDYYVSDNIIALKSYDYDKDLTMSSLVLLDGKVLFKSEYIYSWDFVFKETFGGPKTSLLRIVYSDKHAARYINLKTGTLSQSFEYGEDVSINGRIEVKINGKWGYYINEEGSRIE